MPNSPRGRGPSSSLTGGKGQRQQAVQQQSPKLSPKEKINSYLHEIQGRIVEELEVQKSLIASKKIPLLSDKFKILAQKDEKNLKSLIQQRKTTQLKLKALTDKEFEYQIRHRENLKEKRVGFLSERMGHRIGATTRINNVEEEQGEKKTADQNYTSLRVLKPSRSMHKIRPKSELTQEDAKLLKSLKRQHEQFEQHLNEKTAAFENFLEQIKSENEEVVKKQKQEKSQKKKQELEKRLAEIEGKRKTRILQFQEENRKLFQLKKKPKLFAQWSQQFESKEQLFEQSKVEKMKERLRRRVVDLSSLEDHEREYEEQKAFQQEELQRKREEQSEFLMSSKLEVQKSRFYRSVLKEEKSEKLERRSKDQASYEKAERMKEYSKRVHEEHAPRLKTKEDEEEQMKAQNVKKDKSLSEEERKQTGNLYLKQAIKALRKQQETRSVNKSTTKTSQESTAKSSNLPRISGRYKDYLTESIKFRQSPEGMGDAEAYKRKIYNKKVDEVKKIMEKEYSEKTRYSTINKIKEIAEGLEHDPNDRNYYSKIDAKIRILETIT